MKKFIYLLILPLVVVGGLVFANREIKNEPPKKSTPKPLSAAEMEAERKNWEATPAGMNFKKWEASLAGRKVLSRAEKLRHHISTSSKMEAVVTSLSLPPGSRLGFGLMVRINGEEYIATFQSEKAQMEVLQSLKVNDKIIMRGHHVSYAPKYSYPIVTVEYAERDGKAIFKRILPEGGC
ncbi:hypothetical protein [Chitinophaga rhizosphaerae]|uniref:hypothetical protein n=1 Tax=Chitinophaga rhizosphaerae TaxID=1864947 RepID=UPI000F814B4A|nr:hypothetical protein [Chitinophaga rhizosphaerae]